MPSSGKIGSRTSAHLVARLAEGAIGQALGFDLEGYLASRQDALVMLSNATGEVAARAQETDYGALFRVTETYRAGAEGQQKTSALLHAFASLLEDLLLLRAGTGHLIRNIDLTAELTRISQTVDVAWIETAVRGMDQVEQGMRRNLLRSLALDSFAVGLAGCRPEFPVRGDKRRPRVRLSSEESRLDARRRRQASQEIREPRCAIFCLSLTAKPIRHHAASYPLDFQLAMPRYFRHSSSPRCGCASGQNEDQS